MLGIRHPHHHRTLGICGLLGFVFRLRDHFHHLGGTRLPASASAALYTGISGGPITIFILYLVLGWTIIFPWYLGMRLKILARVARLRDGYQPSPASNSPVGTGLIQPWKHREL